MEEVEMEAFEQFKKDLENDLSLKVDGKIVLRLLNIVISQDGIISKQNDYIAQLLQLAKEQNNTTAEILEVCRRMGFKDKS